MIVLDFIKSLHATLGPSLQQGSVSVQETHFLLQVIIGARQIGKTTSILHYFQKHHKNNYVYYSADNIFNATPKWLMDIWASARDEKKFL